MDLNINCPYPNPQFHIYAWSWRPRCCQEFNRRAGNGVGYLCSGNTISASNHQMEWLEVKYNVERKQD
jgi:hypothetical protein